VLDAHKQAWAALPPGKKSELFAEVKRATARVAEPWVQAAVRAKGIPDGSPLAGEEWASGPWALLCGLTQYMKTLRRDRAAWPTAGAAGARCGGARNGQVVVDVFPASIYDRLLLSGVSAEVWMQPSVSSEEPR
jgi:aldehyde dehydrogenase (NAD(P)+)